MPDDWKDLVVTTEKFLTKPDWSEAPSGDFDYMREMLEYPGTVTEITSINNKVPRKLKYKFANLSKVDEYSITDFFINHRGRHLNFWVPVWKNQFTLYTNIVNGDSIISVLPCGFYRIDQGYELIFFQLKNGDYISRLVTAVINMGTYEDIILDKPMTRDITQDEILFFGRLLLARFDNDELVFNFMNNAASECTLTFLELTNEYEES
jgi:hypothetical protein